MVYIQSDNERKLPHHFDCACAMYGAIENVMDYRLTTFDEVVSGKFDNLIPNHLFVGSVEFMREVFNRIGLKDVRLPINSNREYELITLGEAQSRVKTGTKLFIKPVQIKLFSGVVLDGMKYSFLSTLPDDTMVIAYEPFPTQLISEWRVYIHNNKIVDSRNYSGDFTTSPQYNYVKEVVMENRKTFPSAYTIDVGVLDGGENVVVEFNDMWSIGNYGVPNYIYLRMLRERYFEIIRNRQA